MTERTMHQPPDELAATRTALHRLATYVVAPTRYAATQRFGLRSTLGGFGTPTFDGRQIRVEGDELVDDRNGAVSRQRITTLDAAALFLGSVVDPTTAAEHDSPPIGDVHEQLNIDVPSSRFLGQWFAVSFDALGEVAGDAESVDASEPQLWPGHFDAAIEVGDENHRGSYGASPGDHATPEPYLYLSIWWPDRIGVDPSAQQWNASAFTGSMLRFSDFPNGADPVKVATDFWRTGRDAL